MVDKGNLSEANAVRRRPAVAGAEAERQRQGGGARGSDEELELGGVAGDRRAKGGTGGGGAVEDGEAFSMF